MKKLLRPLFAFVAVPLFLFLLVWGAGQYVSWYTAPFRYSTQETTPEHEAAVVFGAGLKRNGEVGAVLKARLDDAVALYKAKKATKVVVSGDNVVPSYDEVTPMVKYVTTAGVAADDVVADRKGISTYDTCYRLNHNFEIKKAILVTNDFHLPRAVYTCRTLGVDAVGLATPNYPGYEYNSNQRESLARVKMLIDLYLAPPKPLD